MKQVVLEKSDLESCVSHAQREQILVLRNGKPAALIVGVEGMDREQLELGANDRFWKLITARRKQQGISRAALERKLVGDQ